MTLALYCCLVLALQSLSYFNRDWQNFTGTTEKRVTGSTQVFASPNYILKHFTSQNYAMQLWANFYTYKRDTQHNSLIICSYYTFITPLWDLADLCSLFNLSCLSCPLCVAGPVSVYVVQPCPLPSSNRHRPEAPEVRDGLGVLFVAKSIQKPASGHVGKRL